MNKTVFFKTFRRLFGFVLAISLSASVLTAQAQNARITLNLSDVPMSQVMKEIEKQTRYLFINKGVDTGKKLSVNLTQKTIQEVLDYVLKNTDITYKIDGTYIILAEKAAEKPVAVTGKVSDVNGVPVIGASVVVKGTTVGTSTDMDGTFSLQVPPPAATAQLEVNFLGYEPVMVSVGNRTSFDVTLHEAASEIEGVVVTALGIKRQEKALSYNVQQVKAEDITTVKDVGSMQDEALAVYTARQEALFAPIRAWHEAHPSHALVFRGFTGAVTETNMPLLDECAYIILPTNDVKTLDEMSFSALTAVSVAGVPADRLIVTAQTTRPGDDKKEFGYTGMVDAFGDTVEAIEAWAGWVTLPSPGYTRAGLLIEDVQYDYYNPAKVWAKTREAIGIMNPSI